MLLYKIVQSVQNCTKFYIFYKIVQNSKKLYKTYTLDNHWSSVVCNETILSWYRKPSFKSYVIKYIPHIQKLLSQILHVKPPFKGPYFLENFSYFDIEAGLAQPGDLRDVIWQGGRWYWPLVDNQFFAALSALNLPHSLNH